MTKKKITVIGAGITGLSAGIYAQKNGFQSEIFEKHTIPGGLCTSWRRGEYLIDGCIHWLIGSNKNNPLYSLLDELTIIENTKFVNHEIFRVVTIGSNTLTIYSDIYRFEKELISVAPEDKRQILMFTNLVKKFTKFSPPLDKDFGSYSMADIFKMTPFMPSFLKYKSISLNQFCNGFKNRFLREAFFNIMPVANIPMIIPIFSYSYFHNKAGGFPIGGSLKLAKILENEYIRLGGKINYCSEITKIIVQNNNATGVILNNSQTIASDIIISCADGHLTLNKLLDGKYTPKKLSKFYQNTKPWSSTVYVALGVDFDLSNQPKDVQIKLEKPLILNNSEIKWFGYSHYSFDESFAPRGKSVIIIWLAGEYEFWRNLYDTNKDGYKKAKQQSLDFCIDQLENIFPGISKKIEMTDVATPVTFNRYTNNYNGSIQGWEMNKKNFGSVLPKKLNGLNSFYMASQWTILGGGVPTGLMQGKNLIHQISKDVH